MQHLPEILKIIEGAVQTNSTMVVSYAELLAEKLDKAGEQRSAERIRKKLIDGKSTNKPRTVKPQFLNSRDRDEMLPVDQDSRLDLADVYYPDYQSSQVQLPAEIDASVAEFLQFIDKSVKQREKLISY